MRLYFFDVENQKYMIKLLLIKFSYWMEYNMVRNLLPVRNCEFEIRN